MSTTPASANGLTGYGASRHWPASLHLGFDAHQGRTRMQQMKFVGPLRVQRPFYPEGEVCHSYLLHPPGGMVSGDDLAISIDCQPGSQALITTPSAGKIYRADSCGVRQRQQVDISVNNAHCEWLPMETILFDGAHGELQTRIHLHGEARYCGIEMICLGRPRSDKPFISGVLEQSIALYHNNKPVLLDRQLLDGTAPLLHAAAGFSGCHVSGTLIAYGLGDQAQAWVEQLREQLTLQSEQGWLSVTQRLGVLLVRYLGDDSEYGMSQLRHCWSLLRAPLMQRPPCVPRIWST